MSYNLSLNCKLREIKCYFLIFDRKLKNCFERVFRQTTEQTPSADEDHVIQWTGIAGH